jgi:hypothetical protein
MRLETSGPDSPARYPWAQQPTARISTRRLTGYSDIGFDIRFPAKAGIDSVGHVFDGAGIGG